MHLPNLSIKIGIPYAQMPDIYTACDVVYFPSRYEGFEMITLEALACGIPVVGSRVGAIGYLLDKKFPGVYPAFTQGSEHLHGVLMHAAEEWSDTPRKYTLHEMVEKEFGMRSRTRQHSRKSRERLMFPNHAFGSVGTDPLTRTHSFSKTHLCPTISSLEVLRHFIEYNFGAPVPGRTKTPYANLRTPIAHSLYPQ